MPLPPHIINVSAFLCEKTLREPDGVLSAIRIVDLFRVGVGLPPGVILPEGVLPHIQAFGCVLIKSKPGRYEHIVQLKIENTVGEISDAGEPLTLLMANKPGMEDLPSGVAIQAEINIGVKRYGTCYFLVYIEGDEAARIPFTIQQLPSPENANG